jgi:hypothetical protein
MSFPTCNWGNLFDVYTTIPGPTASSPNSSDGPVLGNSTILADGSVVQFVQFVTATSTAANAALIWNGAPTLYKMTASSATNQLLVGVNDLSGGSATNNNTATSGGIVTVNYCAFVKRKGMAFPLVKASAAADAILVTTATAGTLDAGTDAGNCVNLVVVGGSAAVSPAFMN